MDAGTVDATGFGTFDTDYGVVAGYGTFGRFDLVGTVLSCVAAAVPVSVVSRSRSFSSSVSNKAW